MRLLADATLPTLSKYFESFHLDTYHNREELQAKLPCHDILVCRSTLTVDRKLLHSTPVKIVGTASSGINHLDLNWLRENRIQWFSARRANAHAVADYVCIVLAWLKKQSWWGKTAGLIGYGAVGQQVAPRLNSLGFTVKVYDPLITSSGDYPQCRLTDLQNCDLVCIHCNYHRDPPFPSHHLINAAFLRDFNSEGILLNAARGDIVDEIALLKSGRIRNYCTDVFTGEPFLNTDILQHCKLATPHIAGHSIEAKVKAVALVAKKIHNACNLPFTASPSVDALIPAIDPDQPDWFSQLLQHYDPETDFIKLKGSKNIHLDFEGFRAAHNFRHDLQFSE